MSEIRVSEIRGSEIRGSEIIGSEIRVSKIRGSEIRVSEIRVSEIRISSNHRELHGAIFFRGGSKGFLQVHHGPLWGSEGLVWFRVQPSHMGGGGRGQRFCSRRAVQTQSGTFLL